MKYIKSLLFIVAMLLLTSCRHNNNSTDIPSTELHISTVISGLLEKNSASITISDAKLLLETPTSELSKYFNISPEDISYWMMGNTATAPMDGVEFCYSYQYSDETETLPQYLDSIFLWYHKEKGYELPIGYSINEVLDMPQWGETTIEKTLYAGGYNSQEATPLETINYTKDGLHFSFRTDYNNMFLPQEEHDKTVVLVVISMAGSDNKRASGNRWHILRNPTS